MTADYAIHSDFLIHWTGKDLDAQYDSDWDKSDRCTIEKESSLSQAYIERLHNILRYGLWLTEEAEEQFLADGKGITIPSTPKLCFTELKLSESRNHARRYGRLGIGVKRPYLFSRFGRPLAYFGFHAQIQNDPFLKACATDFKDKNLLNFFKPMNSSQTLNYDLYSESEWRILFFQELLNRNLLIDPRDDRNSKAHTFFNSLTPPQQKKLKYLAPLDGWFAMIIYPSLDVKNKAQQEDSTGIRREIYRVKSKLGDHGNNVEGGNWPIEVNLDACRNF
jgi:hypothetical protein